MNGYSSFVAKGGDCFASNYASLISTTTYFLLKADKVYKEFSPTRANVFMRHKHIYMTNDSFMLD